MLSLILYVLTIKRINMGLWWRKRERRGYVFENREWTIVG